jgi:predicted DNA-binding transcriptional regulator AlpA
MEKKYYRPNELKVYCGVALSTVWLYAKQGKLTPIKLSPRVTVFAKEEIDNLFNVDVVA